MCPRSNVRCVYIVSGRNTESNAPVARQERRIYTQATHPKHIRAGTAYFEFDYRKRARLQSGDKLDFIAVYRMRCVRRSGDETIFLLIIEISASIVLFTTPNTSCLFSV